MTNLRCLTVYCLAAIKIVLATATLAFSAENLRPHVAFNLASHHIGATRDFEEFNPGVGIGFTLPVGARGFEIAAEVGQYHNSVGRNSVYATGSLDVAVAQIAPRAQLRLGGFGGFAYYQNASDKFKGGGVPMIGDWLVIGGAQATVRIDDTYDIRLRALPAGKAANAILTLQLAVRF